MFQSIKLRTLIAAVVTIASIYFLLPSVMPEIPASVKNVFLKNRIHLGLDLQGGMHLVLEVDTAKAMESTVERLANNVKEGTHGEAHPLPQRGAQGRQHHLH